MKLDSLDKESQIKLQGILYRSSCRAWWMLAIISFLVILYLGPLFEILEGWVAALLLLAALIFSILVALWPGIPLNEISNALPSVKQLSESEKEEINRSGDRLKDYLAPFVLFLFLIGVMFLKSCHAL